MTPNGNGVLDSLRRGLAERLHGVARKLEDRAAAARPDRRLQEMTREIGDEWRQSRYYDEAEPAMDKQWNELLWPLLDGCDFSSVVDLAAGHGRNSAKLGEHAGTLWVVDINQENIDVCRRRFGADPRFRFLRCDGLRLDGIADGSISLVYCFDAMVHFDSDTVRSYLKEFCRILRPGGRGLCHHSNYSKNPLGGRHENPHGRNFMSRELFAHGCHKEGLKPILQKVIDWGEPALDCITVFEKI